MTPTLGAKTKTRRGWGTQISLSQKYSVDPEVHATAGREAGATFLPALQFQALAWGDKALLEEFVGAGEEFFQRQLAGVYFGEEVALGGVCLLYTSRPAPAPPCPSG